MSQTIPRFIVCQNPRCGQVKQVCRPYEQKIRKYCTRRCSNVVHGNITRAAASRGGLERARRARLALVARIAGLTPLEAFRLGYTKGLMSKTRQLHKRRETAA